MGDDPKLGRVGERPSWVRTGSVFVRAAHLLAASAVAGAYLFSVPAASLGAWWIVAGATGVLLVVAEVARHRELFREVAGWATNLKLVLLACIAIAPSAAGWLVSAAIIVAGLGAHFPRTIRHRRLF